MRRLFIKFASFVPIVLLVAAVNRSVDPARFYGTHFLDPSRDQYEGAVIDNLLAGRSQVLVGPYNERLVLEAVFRSKRPIDTLVLGSSVAKPINGDSFPGENLYNAAIYGGELEEAAAVYQLAWENGRRPKRVVLEFHGRELGGRNWDIVPELVPVMLRVRKRLGLPSDDSESIRELFTQRADRTMPDNQSTAAQFVVDQSWLHPYDKLFSPRYFQFSLRSLGNAWFDAPTVTVGSGGVAPQPEDERQVLCPDGSVLWSRKWLSHTAEQIRQLVQSDAMKPVLWNRPPLSPSHCRLFDAFITDLERSGIKVILVLVPPFPAAFDRMHDAYARAHKPCPLDECESYVRAFAKKHSIQIDGSLDPRKAGVAEDEFVDYIHMRRDALARLIARNNAAQQGPN
jgi:hypothetical protein